MADEATTTPAGSSPAPDTDWPAVNEEHVWALSVDRSRVVQVWADGPVTIVAAGDEVRAIGDAKVAIARSGPRGVRITVSQPEGSGKPLRVEVPLPLRVELHSAPDYRATGLGGFFEDWRLENRPRPSARPH